MGKKILSMFLVLCMVFGMLPGLARAEAVYMNSDAGKETIADESVGTDSDPADVTIGLATAATGSAITTTGSAITLDLWVGGEKVTDENKEDIKGTGIFGGKISYDPDTNTLTLDGAEIVGAYEDEITGNKFGIYASGDLNINLVNDMSNVVGTNLDSSEHDSTGIYVAGNLLIEGDQTLLVTSGKAEKGFSNGIMVGGNLTIDISMDKVLSVGAGDAIYSYGIFSESIGTTLTINKGQVEAYGSLASEESCGISWLGEVIVEGGAMVKATGFDSEKVSSGINASNIIIEGGMVEANGGSAADSHGINGFSVLIDGGELEANGGSATESCGIHVMGVTINGGMLKANGGSGVDSHGINAMTFTINDGTAEANGGSATESSYGIFIGESDKLYINGGKVTASSYGDKYQALNITPVFNEANEFIIFAGDNPTDGTEVSKTEFETGVKNNGYRYVVIETVIYYDVWVGDVQVTSLNKDNIIGEDRIGEMTGHISFDPDFRTLTLDNANIYVAYEDTEGNWYGIYSGDYLNIERIGHSSIVGNGTNKDHSFTGIYVNGDLTVSGDGTLVAGGGAAKDGDSYGIYINGGVLVANGGILIASGSPVTGSSSTSCGIAVHNGAISIGDDAYVEAAGDAAEWASFGVFMAGKDANLTVNSGILKAEGNKFEVELGQEEAEGNETIEYSYGIYFYDEGGTLQVESGRVEAVSNHGYNEGAGIAADKVIVNDGVLDAYGKSKGLSYGIFSDIKINGGKVYAYTDGTDSVSRAMSKAPEFASGNDYLINAGTNGADAKIVPEKELTDNISSYKYIEIETIIYYGIWVGDVPVTSVNNNNIICEHIVNGFVSYNPDTNTLTLEDAFITDTAYEDGDGNKYGIYSNITINIELKGNSSIVIPGANKNKNATGIYVMGSLTIYGDGSLVVTGGAVAEDEQGNSFGLDIEGGIDGGDLLILGGSLTTYGAPASGTYSGSYGICIDNGDLIVSDNAVLEAAGDVAGYESIGIYLGKDGANLVVNSGSLDASGAMGGNNSYGIYFESTGTLTVDGGSVTAISSKASQESCGICADKIVVNGGKLDAFADSDENYSFGIISKSMDIEINGGALYAYCGTGEGSRAMNVAPKFGNRYSHRINAGTNGADAVYVTDDEFAKNIAVYKYIEITPYTPGGGNGEGGGGGGSYTPVPNPAPTNDSTNNTVGSVDRKVEVKAKADSNGTLNINLTEKDIADAIANAKAEAKKNGIDEGNITLVINVSADVKDVSGFTANLSKAVQELIIGSNISGIEFAIGNPGIAIGISNSALSEISRQAGADVEISVEKADSSGLSNEAKDAIGSRPVYEFNVSYQNGSKKVSNFGDGKVYVSIPYTPAKGEEQGYLHIVYVDEKGKVSLITESLYDENSKSIYFAVNHFSVYGVGYTEPKSKFTDIKNHWAKDSIDFAVSKGLLSEIKKNKFAPDNAVTREALAMALGKLAEIDIKAYDLNSFTDVKDDSLYRPYIEWAYRKGIMDNTGDREFDPKAAVTREEIALIMNNFVKVMNYELPAVRVEFKFADASSIGSIYAEAVKAMQQAGIMTVKKNNKFSPKSFVTRAEFCTMIHRFVKVSINPDMAQEWAKNDAGQYMYYKDGKAVTGWQTIGSKTYYFNAYGILVSGKWMEIDGKWYYFDKDGVLAKNTKIDGFEVDKNGVRKTE